MGTEFPAKIMIRYKAGERKMANDKDDKAQIKMMFTGNHIQKVAEIYKSQLLEKEDRRFILGC